MTRLAFAIHYLNPWGGQEQSTLEVARRLSRRFDVDLCVYGLDDPVRDRDPASWGDFEIHRARPRIGRPAVFRMALYHLYSLAWFRWLPLLLGKPRPVVHSTGTCSLVGDVIQVQFVHTAWDAVQSRLPSRASPEKRRPLRAAYHAALTDFDMWLEKRIYRKDRTYIVIARTVADELERHFGIRGENVHVIHHGAALDRFEPVRTPAQGERRREIRAELGVGEKELAVIFVGAYERKGLATAVRALAELTPALREMTKLVAVGTGDREYYLALARELGIEGRVVLVPNQKSIEDYYRACDAFLLPTLYEPFGMVILEAMASGLPTIASRQAGASELIEDGKSGILIGDPTSVGEVAAALARVISDPGFRASLGAEARKVAEGRSWDRVAEEYAAVLGPILKGRS